MCSFETEREREHKWGGGSEGEGEEKAPALMETDAVLDPRTLTI